MMLTKVIAQQINGMVERGARMSPGAGLDHPPLVAAVQIERLANRWAQESNIATTAEMNLADMVRDSDRYHRAVERIANRRAGLLAFVAAACSIPVHGPAERRALQHFANLIEIVGSAHEDRDLEMIEARLGTVIAFVSTDPVEEPPAPIEPPPPPKRRSKRSAN